MERDQRMERRTTTNSGVRPCTTTSIHFEFLVLEAAQAGLSWLTILKRRDGYRKAYRGIRPAARCPVFRA